MAFSDSLLKASIATVQCGAPMNIPHHSKYQLTSSGAYIIGLLWCCESVSVDFLLRFAFLSTKETDFSFFDPAIQKIFG